MIARTLVSKLVMFFRYMVYEKEKLIPGNNDLANFKGSFLKDKPGRYSCIEEDGRILLKKKSIIFPSSHYIALSADPKGVRCEVKMNAVERGVLFFALGIISAIALSLPFIAGIALLLPIDKHNLAAVAPLILVAVIALMGWLKLICFILAYISGVTKFDKPST